MKAIRFELVADRDGALHVVLDNPQALTAIQVRVQRTKSIAPDIASFAALSKLP